MYKSLIILLTVNLAFIACSPKIKPVYNMKPDATFDNTQWKMVKLSGITLFPVLKKDVFIQFDSNTRKYRGYAGCNNMMGTYSLENGELKIGPAAMTRMFCEGPAMEVEAIYSKLLEKIDGYEIKGDHLFLKTGEMVVAEFDALYL